MSLISSLGYIAAFLTTASFIPQALLVIKTRNTSGLSLIMYMMFTIGVTLWLIYGLLSRDWPIVIANFFTLMFAIIILVIIIINKIKPETEL